MSKKLILVKDVGWCRLLPEPIQRKAGWETTRVHDLKGREYRIYRCVGNGFDNWMSEEYLTQETLEDINPRALFE